MICSSMGIDDVELLGVRRSEGAAERPGGLSGERRSRSWDQPTVGADREAIDKRGTVIRADPGADQVRAGRVKEDGAGFAVADNGTVELFRDCNRPPGSMVNPV